MAKNTEPQKTVFILGAGASKQGGAPLMGEFLDVATDLYLPQTAALNRTGL